MMHVGSRTCKNSLTSQLCYLKLWECSTHYWSDMFVFCDARNKIQKTENGNFIFFFQFLSSAGKKFFFGIAGAREFFSRSTSMSSKWFHQLMQSFRQDPSTLKQINENNVYLYIYRIKTRKSEVQSILGRCLGLPIVFCLHKKKSIQYVQLTVLKLENFELRSLKTKWESQINCRFEDKIFPQP